MQGSHRSSVSAVTAAPRHTEVSAVTHQTVASGGSHRTRLSATSRPAGPAASAGPAGEGAAAPRREETARPALVAVSGKPVHQLHDIPQSLLDRCKPAFTPSWCKPDPPLPFQKKAPVFDQLAGQPALDFLLALKKYIEHYRFTEKVVLTKVLHHVLVGAAKELLTFPVKDLKTWASFQRHFLGYYLPKGFHTQMMRELDRHYQGDEEPLLSFLTVIEEYYQSASPETSGQARVERVARQAHNVFRPYIYMSRCRNSAELAESVNSIKRVVEDAEFEGILPPKNTILMPRLGWDNKPYPATEAAPATPGPPAPQVRPMAQPEAGKNRNRNWKQGGGRAATGTKPAASPVAGAPAKPAATEAKPAATAAATTAEPKREEPQGQAKKLLVCYKCSQEGHFARNCPNAKN